MQFGGDPIFPSVTVYLFYFNIVVSGSTALCLVWRHSVRGLIWKRHFEIMLFAELITKVNSRGLGMKWTSPESGRQGASDVRSASRCPECRCQTGAAAPWSRELPSRNILAHKWTRNDPSHRRSATRPHSSSYPGLLKARFSRGRLTSAVSVRCRAGVPALNKLKNESIEIIFKWTVTEIPTFVVPNLHRTRRRASRDWKKTAEKLK